MSYRAFTHIALILTPLRQAEEFYRTLFALEVAFREAETADGWLVHLAPRCRLG